MTQRVYIVSVDDIIPMLPTLGPWLTKMAKWTRGRRTVEDIIARVMRQESVLWVTLGATGRLSGALITAVEQYPRMRMLQVLHCAGERGHMEEVADEVYNAIDAFAMFNKCAGVEFIGRPGWEPHVAKRGYEVRSVTFQKFFEGEPHA